MIKTFIYSTKLKDLQFKKYSVSGLDCNDGLVPLDEDVGFAMNAVVGNHVSEGDDVRVMILENSDSEKGPDGADLSEKVVIQCKEECNRVFSYKGCDDIKFSVIRMPFKGTAENIKSCYMKMLDALEYETEIYFDMTYGPKFIPPIAFSAFNYAERFFKCNVRAIYYGEVHFSSKNALQDSVLSGDCELRELTSVYRLGSFCSLVQASPDAFKYLAGELFH